MKILALYGSRFGQAEAVLRRIVGTLEGSGHSVTMMRADTIPPGLSVQGFGGVVVAASIIMGRYQRYVRRWVAAHADSLNARPGAFISVNGTPPEPTAEWRTAANRYVSHFVDETGWRPRWIATFAGALRYSRYGPVTRWIMKRIAASQGGPTDTSRDYDFTDWEAVDRLGSELAAHFSAALPGVPVPTSV